MAFFLVEDNRSQSECIGAIAIKLIKNLMDCLRQPRQFLLGQVLDEKLSSLAESRNMA